MCSRAVRKVNYFEAVRLFFFLFCDILAGMKHILKILHAALIFLLKLCGIVLFCLAFSFIFVYPLWLFAVKQPDAFSSSVLILFAFALGSALILKIKSGKKK